MVQRHGIARDGQIGSHFAADQTAADNAPGRPQVPVQKALPEPAQFFQIDQIVQAEKQVTVWPEWRRDESRRALRQYQFVIRQYALPVRSADRDSPVGPVDARGLGGADNLDVLGAQLVEGLQDDALFDIIGAEAPRQQRPRIIAVVFARDQRNPRFGL